MPSSLTGTHLRERRLALGRMQSEVARAVGVSASYLNLIEHNRRRVGEGLLSALAAALDIPPETLVQGVAGAVVDDLRAAAATAQALGSQSAELDRVDEFAGRFPGWALVISALHRRLSGLDRAVEALNDRMTHDPHLSASLHEVLQALSSVRSTAAILAESDDIDPDWLQRFHANLHQDAERMAAGAEALVAYLDGSDSAPDAGIVAPQDEMEAWLAARDWSLPELDDGRLALLQAEVASLASGAARELAGAWLRQAAQDAARVAMVDLLDQAGTVPDPIRLAQRFGVGVEVIFRRLALMPGRGFGLVVCDASGTLTFRRPAEGFPLPRFGSACPLWPLFAALAQPGRALAARLAVAGRGERRFTALATAVLAHPEGFAGPELRQAMMLILPDAGNGAPQAPPALVGPTCRICPRADCPARREPSIVSLG